ncbi:MAG: ABC transporter substrate-binding protein [Clostridia bacterium]|nr:ABC transporter substrate-binding protein [Clostridia bacterium]
MRRWFCLWLLLGILLSLPSCGASDPAKGEGVSLTDDLGNVILIRPEDRVAACHASFADAWLLAGGTLAGATLDAVEEHGLAVGEAAMIGTAKTVNAEAMVAAGITVALLSADLAAHLTLKEHLESLGIACAYFRVDTFSDYASVMERFCAVTGRSDLYEQHVTRVAERIAAVRAVLPGGETRSLLLMRVYSTGIKAKGEDHLAGQIVKEFGFSNLADANPSLLETMSLEHIVATDPDVILVLTMGNEAAALGYLEGQIETNPAFAGLTAVREGRYFLLPRDLFHYKPNERWDESYEYLAKLLYPEVFAAS